MLTRIDVRSVHGNILSLSLEDSSSGFVVENVEGLGPVKANLVSSPFANMDGEQYHSSRRDLRNIVITLDLVPDYISTSVQDLRIRLYRFFMPKSIVGMTFVMDDGKSYVISGIVESCEPVVFSKDPQISVSIMCHDPDFVDPAVTVLTANSVNVTVDNAIPFDYVGTVETGVKLVVNVNRTVGEITLYHNLPDGSIRSMEIAYPFLSGDVVTVVTDPGKKSVMLTRGSTTSSILFATPPQAYWMSVDPGLNYHRVHILGTPAIPYRIEYSARYGGL